MQHSWELSGRFLLRDVPDAEVDAVLPLKKEASGLGGKHLQEERLDSHMDGRRTAAYPWIVAVATL